MAEPHNIRELFSEAAEAGHPLLSRVRLDTLVTVVDAHTFGARCQLQGLGLGTWTSLPPCMRLTPSVRVVNLRV